ncbi:unnamed protein product, partial [Urochloa humidicola]
IQRRTLSASRPSAAVRARSARGKRGSAPGRARLRRTRAVSPPPFDPRGEDESGAATSGPAPVRHREAILEKAGVGSPQPCAQAAAARFTGGGHIRGERQRALQPASCPTQLPPSVPMMQPSNNGPQVFLPAEPVQNDEIDPEEVPVSPAPAPTGKRKRTKVVSRIKLTNFKPEEDVNIVKSWLEISCDSIPCTAQKKDHVWKRIVQRYNLRRGSYPERSLKSVQNRWQIIKTEARKFASFYADVIRENPSGLSDTEKITLAAANFAAIVKHNFAYLHCWELIKDEPKWKDPKPKAFAKSAGGDGFGEDSSHDLGDDNGSPPGSAMGRDSAKAAKKKANSSAGSPRAFAKSAGGDGFGEDSSHDLGDDNGSPPGSAMDRDSAKAVKKKANSSAGSTSPSEYASRRQDLSVQKISVMQEGAVRKNDHFQQLACIDEKHFEEMRSYNRSLLECEQEKVRIMREKHDMDRQGKERQEDER